MLVFKFPGTTRLSRSWDVLPRSRGDTTNSSGTPRHCTHGAMKLENGVLIVGGHRPELYKPCRAFGNVAVLELVT